MLGLLWPNMMRRWRPSPPEVDQVTVLLVEDDPLVLEVMEEMLMECGHRVIACRDADECLRALPEADGRVVLVTDVAMRGRSGRALADEFRRRRPDVPVVFATGLPADVLAPLNENETVLHKPFAIRDIAAAVDQAVGVR